MPDSDIRAKLQEYANRDGEPGHSLFPRTLLALLDSAENLSDIVQKSNERQSDQAKETIEELRATLSDNTQRLEESDKKILAVIQQVERATVESKEAMAELKTALSDNVKRLEKSDEKILAAIRQAESAAVKHHQEAKKERAETQKFLGIMIVAAVVAMLIAAIGFSQIG